MFLQNDISLKIISALNLSWGSRCDNSSHRDYHALSYRISGNAIFTHNNTSVKAKTGDIIFVPESIMYNLKCDNEQLIVIHFKASKSLKLEQIEKITPTAPEYFEKLFVQLYDSWYKKHPGYFFQCQSILYKILFKIEQELQNKPSVSKQSKLMPAIEHIHEHYADTNINIQELANMCMMSDTYFRKLFISEYSTTPLKYINQLKVAHAKELLRSKYYTVEEVACKCGFNNIYYFSTYIKKETGLSPSELMK